MNESDIRQQLLIAEANKADCEESLQRACEDVERLKAMLPTTTLPIHFGLWLMEWEHRDGSIPNLIRYMQGRSKERDVAYDLTQMATPEEAFDFLSEQLLCSDNWYYDVLDLAAGGFHDQCNQGAGA